MNKAIYCLCMLGVQDQQYWPFKTSNTGRNMGGDCLNKVTDDGRSTVHVQSVALLSIARKHFFTCFAAHVSPMSIGCVHIVVRFTVSMCCTFV